MKFFTAAVGAFLLSIASTDAKTFTREELDARIMEGKVDKQTILSKAIPYKQYLRRVEEGQDQQQEQYDNGGDYYYNDYDQNVADYAEDMYGDNQIEDEYYQRVYVTAETTIKFNSCVVMQTQNYNLYMDNLISAAQSGRITSIRNYVLFELCTNNSCNDRNWFGGQSNNLYMIDLATFIEAAIAYGPSEKERVCQACQNYAESCGYEANGNYDYYDYDQEQAAADADGDGENADGEGQDANDGQRRNLFDQSVCKQCSAFDCWYDDEGDQDVDAEAIEEWALEINECRVSENGQWNGLTLYSGWMCSEDTAGIDVGVFIDPYCRMHQNSISFSSIMENNDYQYVYQSQDIIPMMFDAQIGCANQDGDEDGAEEISELCETIFYGEFAPRSLSDCGTPMNITAEMIADADEAEYQQNNQNQQDGQNMYQYLQSQQMLYNNYGRSNDDWQNYDLSAQDVLDGAATCNAVATKAASVLEESSGGGWMNGGLPWRNGNNAMSTPSARLTPLEIAWIVLVAVMGTALFMHYTRKQIIKRKKRANENAREVYQRTDDKGAPLIIS